MIANTPFGFNTGIEFGALQNGRQLTESTSVNGTSVSMAYAYDPLGRLKTTTSGSGTNAVTTTEAYNIQGWLTSRTALKGSTNVFSMSLGYYSPVQSGATARYSGDISSWSWTQGNNTAKAYGFAYDGAHRLTAGQYFNNGTSTNALSEKAIGYDLAGNITTLTRYDNAGTGTTLAYAYAGNHRSTYTYDANGNVSSDGTHSLQMAYNLINLPSQIDSGTIVKANYTYLSDGTKARALDASGVGYDYLGSFTYTHDANNNTTLESVVFGGGRVRKNGSGYAVDYYITDHLGSVRAIVNASGTITEQNDYYPFGTRHPNGLTTLSGNRWRFSGKEEQDAAFGVPYSDFGARLYDRTAWTAIDPLAEKYYAVSPYVYCNNNPVKIIDPYGLDIYHFDSSGNYIGKTVQKGIHSIAFNTYDENGDPSVIQYFFVDPVNDPSAIDKGEINNLIFVSENEILGFLNSQGAFDSDLTIWDLAGSSVNASAGPKHNFDYSYSELEEYYNGYREHKNVRSSHLFIVEGEKIAQNLMNLGNYLWSATGYSIGVPTPILLLGAQANNLHLIPTKKSAAYAIPRQFDSLDDQLSIIAGARHAKMNDYRGKRK